MAGEIVAVWIAAGYLLGHLLTVPRHRKASVLVGGFVGNLVANLLGGESLYVSLSFTACGLIEVCTAALLLPQVHSANGLIVPKILFRFVIVAGIFAPLISGLAAVLLLQGVFTTHPFSSFSNWVISDSLGFLIFTPVTINMISGEWRSFLQPSNRGKSLALLSLVGCVTALIFAQSTHSLLYWVLPPLALLAFHAELSTVLLGILICISIAVPFTVGGTGPLWLIGFHTMEERILALQVFTLAALSIALPITALEVQRNRLLVLLRDGQRQFRTLAEYTEEVILQLGPDGVFQYASPRVTSVLGFSVSHFVGAHISGLLHRDDVERVQLAMREAASAQSNESVQYRIRRRDGSLVWVRSFIAAMPVGPGDDKPSLLFTLRDIDEHVLAQQQRDAEQRRLEDLAYIDSLTGLRNRRYFDVEFARSLMVTPENGGDPMMAVLFIDVDYFKQFNTALAINEAMNVCGRWRSTYKPESERLTSRLVTAAKSSSSFSRSARLPWRPERRNEFAVESRRFLSVTIPARSAKSRSVSVLCTRLTSKRLTPPSCFA
ncbi:MASE1 domain-containing protein [Paraburkholderia caledonica]|uniref:MASE1 domain-containing protein n=1 Tax=Paraburkholderia caledonica TaxID=134536 RepID=UPI0038B99A57